MLFIHRKVNPAPDVHPGVFPDVPCGTPFTQVTQAPLLLLVIPLDEMHNGVFGDRHCDVLLSIQHACCMVPTQRNVLFGGQFATSSDSEIEVALKFENGKPLGVELVLTKEIFGNNGRAFVRLQQTTQEKKIESGMKFAW